MEVTRLAGSGKAVIELLAGISISLHQRIGSRDALLLASYYFDLFRGRISCSLASIEGTTGTTDDKALNSNRYLIVSIGALCSDRLFPLPGFAESSCKNQDIKEAGEAGQADAAASGLSPNFPSRKASPAGSQVNDKTFTAIISSYQMIERRSVRII
jgi:hypothetical protein